MKKNTRIRRKKPMVEEIEPRILYSADFAPGVLDSHAVLPQAEQRVLDAGGEFAASAAQTQASAPQSVRHEVVFVDTAVPDYQKLVQDITANSDAQHQYDVVLLKPGADGIKQITQTLSGTHDVSAVHIISHGADGQVELGNTTLNFDSLLKNASQIKSWGQALTSDADVLIYGCDVAEHADGKALINALSRLTDADVAASTDPTGAAARGGNWQLEYRTGATIAALADPAWDGLLAAQTLDWDAQSWAGGSLGPHSYAVGGGNVTVTVTPNFNSSMPQTDFRSGTPEINTSNQGGLPVAENGLNISTSGFKSGEDAVITIDFSHPGGVSNVSFTIFDIDTGGMGSFIDEVQAGYTASGPVTLTITPSSNNTLVGTDTVRGTSQGTQNGPGSGDANATFTFTGSGITQIALQYRNVGSVDNEAITLHDIAFEDNAPPVLATGSVLGYTENQAATAINTAITVSDADDATLSSATVAITGNFASGEDVLGFVNGAGMGNISGSWNAGTGVLTLTSAGASATLANWQTALRAVTYLDSSNNPSTLARTVSYTVNDGVANSNTVTSTVNVASVNDAPTLTATANNPTFTEAAGLGTQAPAVNVFSAANAGTAEAGQNIIGLSFTVGGLLDGASERIVVDGSAITLGANSAGVTATNAMGYTVNIVAGTATVTLSKPAGVSAANINALINGITYQNTNTDAPSAGNRTFTLSQIRDSGGTANGGVDTTALAIASTVNVTAVNDAPTLGATANNPTFTEAAGLGTQAPAVNVFSAANAGTAEAGQNIIGLSFTVGGLLDGASERIVVDGSAITLGANSAGVTATNAMGYTVNIVAGTATVTLSKPAGVSAANVNALINGITYQNTNTDAPSAGNRTFTLTQIRDSGGTANGGVDTTALAIASTVNVASVNDAPTLGATANNPTFTEAAGVGTQAPAVNVFSAANAGTAEAGQNIIGLSFTVGGLLDGAGERIVVDGSAITLGANSAGVTATNAMGYTVNIVAGTATVTLSKPAGVSAANVNALINGITYQNTNTDAPSAGNRTFTLTQIRDSGGTANGGVDTTALAIASTVNVTAVNDAPVLATGSVLGYTESQAATAINTAITVSDADDATLSSAAVAITGNYASGEDVLGFVNGAGMGNISGSWNAGTGVLTLTSAGASATLANWQTALRAVTYLDSSNNPSTLARTVSYTVNDGAANSNTVTSTVNVTSVNDAPQGADNTVATLEDTPYTFATVDFGFSDPSDIPANVLQAVKITTLPATGSLTNNGVAVSAGQFVTLADINLGRLRFTPAANANGIGNASFTFQVQDDGGTAGGGVDTDPTARTMTIDVTAVNDAPALVTPGSQAGAMNAPIIFNGANLISVGDVDAGGFSEQITLSVTQGTLNLSGTAGLTLIGGANGSVSMTYQGTVVNLNAALNGLIYTPNANYSGPDTLSIASDDLGNSGGGGALGANGTVNLTVQVNQAPTLGATANNPTFTEAAGVGTQAPAVNVFSAANAGTAEAGQTIIGLSFTVGGLLDGASERIVVDGSAITLGANSAGVTATNAMGYTVNIVAGTATVTLSKPAGVSAANINALINGITYQNTNTDAPSAGNRTFTLTQIQDSGGTAGAGQDTAALAIASTLPVVPVDDLPVLVNTSLAITSGGSVILSGANLSASDVDNVAAGLSFTVSNVLDGQFELVSTPGVAVTNFTQGAIAGGQVRFVHDGSINPPAFDLTVSDGTLSAGPTAATIAFSVPATGGPIIAPPAPTPPAPPTSNPGSTPPAPPPPAAQPAQPVVTPVVTLSGGLPMAPEPVGVELFEPIRGANPFLQVDGRLKPNLNPAPLIKPAEQTLLIAGTDPQYMEFGPLTKVDWSAQSAFPSADRNPSEHDQIQVIMESVRMGGIALSVGVVWWASRVTGLIGSLLASMPAWRQLDPLPIVGRDEEEDRWDETGDSEADADELAISMVLEGPRSREAVSA